MKKKFNFLPVLFFSLLLCLVPAGNAKAQVIDIIKEAAIKVIKAIDLQVQRLQNVTIELQNIQKQVENTLAKFKLQEIADWTEKQKQLYQDYFDELWRVKSFITYYKRITAIIQKEKELINEYKRAFALIRKDNHFSEEEIQYIQGVYTGIIDKSTESLDQILLLLESFTVQMSDADRLELLNRSADEIETCATDLRRFTDRNTQLSLQRAKNIEEVETLKKLYGIENSQEDPL